MVRKAQAAMEFLMTYGWAILVVLAAIGALAYFGVLSPQQFIPEQCVLSTGMACIDFKISPTESIVVLNNYLGKDVTINTISIGGCNQTFDQPFDNGEQAIFTLTGCDNGLLDESFREDLVIVYTTESFGLTKTIDGTVSTKIQ